MHHALEHSDRLTAIKGIIYILMRNHMHEVDNIIAVTELSTISQYTSSQEDVSSSCVRILNNTKCDTIF